MFKKPLILSGASAVAPAYTIDQSIRFNNTGSNSTSHYFSRTPSSAGNQKTWTLSWWMKVGSGSDRRSLFSRRSGSAGAQAFRMRILEDSLSNGARMDFYMGQGSSVDTQTYSYLFRDPAAWYHCVVTFDTTNVLVEERFKFTVNGVRLHETVGTYRTLDYNTNYVWNSASEHNIGRQPYDNDNWYDGYMAEIVFIDGTAHDATSFAEYNSSNIWIPKNINDQSFTFGTNGFYLTGQDASNLGYDYQTSDRSGTTNDWTSNNFAADDQKKDSPTNNHATWNSLTPSAQTYSNGNLNAASSGNAWKGGFTTAQVPLNSGTWYYEIYVDSAGSSSGQFSVGWSESNRSVSDDNSSGDTEGWVTYAINGSYYANGGSGSLGDTYTTGDVIGCKIDTNSTSNNVEFYKNGASQGTRSQAFNTGGTGFISPYILLYGTRNATARFAQAEWTQTPSGITDANAINTKNLGS
jgi:hypothetical protein